VRYGKFFSPEEAADNLLDIARRRRFRLFRITGSEPILGEASLAHLLAVSDLVSREVPNSKFVLETNGLMLGYRPELSERFSPRNVLVRVSLKGTDPLSFEKMTGAQQEYFSFPLQALKILEGRGFETWPALMEDLFTPAEITRLKQSLRGLGIQAALELESLEPYPFVLDNLRRRGVDYRGLLR
jgi:uncharacterized Fe-S cluster-containing radical SAM superfamily protein